MSKVLNASCSGKIVTCNGVPVDAEILSEGNGPSTGTLILDGEKAYYIASNATDIKTTLEKLASVLTQIGTTLTSIGAGMTGPTTAPPPTLATDVVQINLIVTQLNALKAALK